MCKQKFRLILAFKLGYIIDPFMPKVIRIACAIEELINGFVENKLNNL